MFCIILFHSLSFVFVLLCLCILIVCMLFSVYSVFIVPTGTLWATLTEFFPCFFHSCKTNARVYNSQSTQSAQNIQPYTQQKNITTLQHFSTLHHTSPNHTSLHLSTLHFLSFTLHYPLIWLNPITFRIAKLDTVQFSHLQTYFKNNEPLHCPK